MRIIEKSDEEKESTGIICDVLPFNITEFSIPVRQGTVDVCGSATLNPEWARRFAHALLVAADIAEGKHVEITTDRESSE